MPIFSCTPIKGAEELSSGKEYYRQSNHLLAIGRLTQGIEKNPTHWKFYLYRAKAYQSINKIDLAIIDLSKGLELISKIERWSSKLPEDEWALIYMRRGTLYHQKKQYEFAINDFNKALELYPQCTGAYFYRGVTKEKINLLSEAIEDYSKVIVMMSGIFSGISDSEKMRVYFKRGSIFLRLEKFEKAISDFDSAIKTNPTSAENAYLYRASTRLITSCNLKMVLDDYYSVINIRNIDNDTLQQTYNAIAWILATAENDKIRDGEKALGFANKALEIDKNFLNLDTLAVAYAECGKYQKAEDTAQKAMILCKTKNSELFIEIEKHMDIFLLKKPIRKKCPGFETELKQLRKWQTESQI